MNKILKLVVFLIFATSTTISYAYDFYFNSSDNPGDAVRTPEEACVLNVKYDGLPNGIVFAGRAIRAAHHIEHMPDSALGEIWVCFQGDTFIEPVRLGGTNYEPGDVRVLSSGIIRGGNCPATNRAGVEKFCPTGPNDVTRPGSVLGSNCALKENPVHPATGNKFQSETDFANTGGLSFTRYYNSMSAGNSKLPMKWNADYFQSLFVSSVGIVEVNRADGVHVPATCPETSGACMLDADQKFTLERTIAGFSLVDENDAVELYDPDGNLLSITSRLGKTQTLSYDTNHFLESVTDYVGRTITFTYNEFLRLQSVTDPDGNQYIYNQDANLNLASVVYPDNTPNDPDDNLIRTYQYGDPQDTSCNLSGNTDSINLLTGIFDENGNRFSKYCYDIEGRVTLSEHDGGANRISLTYDDVNNQTTIVDALGASNTYSYEIVQGAPKTSSVLGGQCASGCGDEGQAQTYDANGFLASRTDFEGNTTNFTNNTRGLQEGRTEAVGTPEARTITTEWHPTFRLPTKITEPGKETVFTYDAQGKLLSRIEREI